MMRAAYIWPAVSVVALLQAGAVGKIVWDRDQLLKSGREIVLPVVPRDPRDVFRGDYVVLNYGLSPVGGELFSADDVTRVRRAETVYVTIRKGADGAWKPVAGSLAYPDKVTAEDVVLKGRVVSTWGTRAVSFTTVGVGYGIESYFVPEGTGGDLENAVRDKKVEAIVAVGSDGEAALKGLIVGGERRVAPPLL